METLAFTDATPPMHVSPSGGIVTAQEAIILRRGTPEDAQACGTICYEAFRSISTQHNFPPDFPSPEVAIELASFFLARPDVYGVVAERGGRIVGSNFLSENTAVAGVGPITVDPAAQNGAVGRHLMDDVLARARERGVASVRLVQAGYHNRSLSLYTKLGFTVREPLATLQGPAIRKTIAGYKVRPATEADLDPCNRVCRMVHGFDRNDDLLGAIQQRTASVVEHDRRITGYATGVGFFGHAVGETNEDLKALIGAASQFAGPGFLLPIRNGDVFRWCLARGLRIVQPMTLMSHGFYNEPAGAFLPSVLY